MFYAGDGVSDLSAAKETDLLFAKKGHGKALPPKDETGNWVLTTL
jgi:2-hydroxy-3-keto-5-methylthiopentenyl-1-phosphate phosphatase